uniref:Uncharacterized protein n=1 Tax=Arundo donax TaxID=35708 RepID=A0A0A9EIG0_ARUDO
MQHAITKNLPMFLTIQTLTFRKIKSPRNTLKKSAKNSYFTMAYSS